MSESKREMKLLEDLYDLKDNLQRDIDNGYDMEDKMLITEKCISEILDIMYCTS